MVVLNAQNQKLEVKMEANDKIVLVAQEISFAKKLASNDHRQRDRTLRKLRKWLQNRALAKAKQNSPFTRDDMMRLWKGLFYCMWMSDKPLVQEELAENISGLVHCLGHERAALNFVEAFFLTLRTEWFSIDTFRIGKFQMLVRRVLRQGLIVIASKQWNSASTFADILWTSVLSVDESRPPPLGLGMHVCEIFLEEVAKVSGKTGISQKALTSLLSAFARCLASKSGDARLRMTVCSEVFAQLIKQSDAGLEHQEKLRAWKQMGCPAIPLEQLQRVEVEPMNGIHDEEGEKEKKETQSELDPRAGQLDVELPQIPFHAGQVAALLHRYMKDPATNAKARRRIKHVAQKFEELARGKYPLAFSVPLDEEGENDLDEDMVDAAAEELQRFQQQLDAEEVEMGVASTKATRRINMQQQLNGRKTRKRRVRRKSAWRVTSVNEEQESSTAGSSPGTQGQWEVSPAKDELQSKFSEWDQPLQEGEYEYFVQPRKRKALTTKKSNKKLRSEPSSPEEKTEENTRMVNHDVCPSLKPRKFVSPKTLSAASSPASSIIARRTAAEKQVSKSGLMEVNSEKFAQLTSPAGSNNSLLLTPITNAVQMPRSASGKRVDIQLKHNKFQEVHEHAEQIRNSPGVPHDPNKKPTKSLLKPSTPLSSPVITKKRSRILFS